MEKDLIPITVVFGFAIIISFWIKGILDNNNYKVNSFSGYFRDTKNIFNLSTLTRGKVKKKYFFMLGLLNILTRVGILILFILFVAANIKESDAAVCDSYKDFKSSGYNYLIINKYIDSSQHSYPTLVLQDKKGNQFKNLDLIFDKSDLFGFLSIGDSMIKKNGTGIVRITNNKIDTTFKVDFGCDEK